MTGSNLKLNDLNLKNGSIVIRQGKGAKDRIAPLGKHAIKWPALYIENARPSLLGDSQDGGHLWLNAAGFGSSAFSGFSRSFPKRQEQAQG